MPHHKVWHKKEADMLLPVIYGFKIQHKHLNMTHYKNNRTYSASQSVTDDICKMEQHMHHIVETHLTLFLQLYILHAERKQLTEQNTWATKPPLWTHLPIQTTWETATNSQRVLTKPHSKLILVFLSLHAASNVWNCRLGHKWNEQHN